MSDTAIFAIKCALVGVGGYIIYRKVKGAGSDIVKGFYEAVPQVVKDGAEAGWQLGGLAANIITDPLDAFGIIPAQDITGAPAWTPTAPHLNNNDPVSNGDTGFNWNLF
jgi:hypothetical protein